jgi:UDP-sulfoquinovose synthase
VCHERRNNMRIIVAGGDGFCGWATTLRLAASDHEVLVLDNLSRRKIDVDLGTRSLTQIFEIEERILAANEKIGKISFQTIDLAKNYQKLLDIILNYRPDAIVHFAEQRAAPYSMLGARERRYTIENNTSTTHNICSAIIDSKLDVHMVHLGTMGVYGYDDKYGSIPEGYLDITINSTKQSDSIVYPPNPGSIYHLTKVLDHQILQFYQKNWNLRCTDLHQGIVWGVQTKETKSDKKLSNRFDYDGVYGTVFNRFIVQAINGHPLTVYGTGGQTRAFIHIEDTAECIKLSIENPPTGHRVRVMNQVSETKSVNELAKLVSKLLGGKIANYNNPHKEAQENELKVSNSGLLSLGFKPKLISDSLLLDTTDLIGEIKQNFIKSKVLNSPNWT